MWANLLLPKKLSLSSQKCGFGIRDPGKTYSGSRKKTTPRSGKNLLRNPDLGSRVKKSPDPGSGYHLPYVQSTRYNPYISGSDFEWVHAKRKFIEISQPVK